MIDWKRPFDGAIGLILCISLICFGALVGLSLGFFSRELRLGEGWSSVITAGVAGCVAICIALYVEHRRDRREWIEPANRVRAAILQFDKKLHSYTLQIRWARGRARRGIEPSYKFLRRHCDELQKLADDLPIELTLPHRAVRLLRDVRADISAKFAYVIALDLHGLEQLPLDEEEWPIFDTEDREPSWDTIQFALQEVRERLTELERYFERLTD